MEDNITLNGKKISKKQLEEERKRIEKTPGAKIVEFKPNCFKIKIEG